MTFSLTRLLDPSVNNLQQWSQEICTEVNIFEAGRAWLPCVRTKSLAPIHSLPHKSYKILQVIILISCKGHWSVKRTKSKASAPQRLHL